MFRYNGMALVSTFNFSRKLPTILIIAIPSLRGEDSPLAIVYDCCYNFYLFHINLTYCSMTCYLKERCGHRCF